MRQPDALTSSMYDRANNIEKIVCAEYCDADTDAVDLAVDELTHNPDRTDAEIARAVAQRILQP